MTFIIAVPPDKRQTPELLPLYRCTAMRYLLQFLSYRYILFMLGTCLQNITGGMLPVLFLAHRRDATSV